MLSQNKQTSNSAGFHW